MRQTECFCLRATVLKIINNIRRERERKREKERQSELNGPNGSPDPMYRKTLFLTELRALRIKRRLPIPRAGFPTVLLHYRFDGVKVRIGITRKTQQ